MRVKMTSALAVAAFLLVSPVAASGHGGHDKGHGDGKVIRVHSGDSIQDAIDKAKPGTTIKVDAGTYHESLLIKTDDIDLVGAGRKLTRIVPPDPLTPGKGCVDSQQVDPPPAPPVISASGICVFDVDDQFNVLHQIEDVHISNLSVTGFNGIGIFLVGTEDAVVKRVIASDNAEYGIFANNSTGTLIARNVTGNDGEAGVYVGDAPHADATVLKNVAYGNNFGIFLRDAAHGQVLENKSFSNCAGFVFLNTDETAEGPPGGPPPTPIDAKDWLAKENDATANNKVCNDEEGAFAGIGIAVVSAADIRLFDNGAFGNVAPENSGSLFAGGIVVVGEPGFKPSTGTKVKFNTALGNEPDILWDGDGAGNEFVGNECLTSNPDGLCVDPADDQGGNGDHGDDDHGHGDHHGNGNHDRNGKKHGKKHGKGHGSSHGARHELPKHGRD